MGYPVKINSSGLACRVETSDLADGKRRLVRLHFRIEKRLTCDVNLAVEFFYSDASGEHVLKQLYAFGDGREPAYTRMPGDVYSIEFAIPAVQKGVMNVSVKKKPEPDFSLPPF